MGCGTSSVPDEILPDPTPGEECSVLFKKTGTFAKDQNVYKDKDTSKKWLLLDKEGGFFTNPTYMLENFVREDGSKRGQVLCSAKLCVESVKTYGFERHSDSDSSSEDSSDDHVETDVEKVKMKWAQAVKVTFYSDREMSTPIAKLKVKAKGKAKRTTTTKRWEEEVRDDEGNVTGTEDRLSVSSEVKKKVKKLKYTITEMEGEEEMPSIALDGKPNGSSYKLEWKSPVFECEIGSNGWGSTEMHVDTKWKNPALGMLMGYIVGKDISPDDIKDNITIPW
jgi:hypothetical protein